MQNRQEFIAGVLVDLNVISLGEAAANEDYEFAASKLTTIVRDLEARGKVYLPDLDEIPDEFVEALTDVVVLRMGPGYGKPPAALADIIAAEDRLKAVSRPPPTRRTLSTDAVLRRGARGVARFNFRDGG